MKWKNSPFFRWGCWLCNVNKWWGLIAPWHCSRPLPPRQSRDHRWRPDQCGNYDRDVELLIFDAERSNACDDSVSPFGPTGRPQIPKLQWKTNYEFSNFLSQDVRAKLWIRNSSRFIPRNPISKMSKKAFCGGEWSLAWILLMLERGTLPCFLLRELTFCTAHRKFGNLACELLFPFSCASYQSFSCFYCDPLSKANKVTTGCLF